MASNNIGIDNEISSFESLKFQILESVFNPYFEKNRQACNDRASIQLNENCSIERSVTTSGNSISNFDTEQTFTDKFLNSVQEDSLLQESLLIQNNILDYNPDSNKNYCFDKLSSTNHQSSIISEEGLKYDINFKDNSTSYLDLSHKSAQEESSLVIQHRKINNNISADSEDKNLENPEIILNLCSRNKDSNLGEDTEKNNEDDNCVDIKEEFDNLSYINPSTILLEERILDRNDIRTISSNTHLNSFADDAQQSLKVSNDNSIYPEKSQEIRDDITKILAPNFNSNITVIDSSNSNTLKDDVKKLFQINSEYSPYVSDVDAALSTINEDPKSSSSHLKAENSDSLIRFDSNSDLILNLKKVPICQENIPSLENSSEGNNISCYSSLEISNKNDKIPQENSENGVKALNLVSKRSKSHGFSVCTDFMLRKSNSIQDVAVMEAFTEVRDDTLETVSKDDSPVSCWKCKNEFPSLLKWNEHKSTGICMAPQYCSHCDIQFNSKSLYEKHMLCHKRNTCSKCSSTFRRRQLLRIHMKLEHGIKLVSKTYTCDHCNRVFMKRSSIYYHLQKHALPHQKVCTKCGKFLESEEAYQDHLNEHVKNSFLRCHLCSAIFERYQQYSDHMKGHKKHICVYCEENQTSFSNKKQLFHHYKTEHPDLPQKVVLNKKKYSCDLCPKIFSRPSQLQDHKITHSNTNHWECRHCNKKYAQRNSLRKHIMSAHTQTEEKNKNVCQHCLVVFSSQTFLNRHIVKMHNIPLSCTHCDFKTQQLKSYRRHLNKHIAKKKFLCDICGSMFQCSISLKDHNLFHHSNERKFKCKECEKSFKNKSCLSRHKRTHSNERPYKCECGMCYKQLSHLSRHLSSVHNKKVSPKKRKVTNNEETENHVVSDLSGESIVTTSSSSAVSEVGKTNDILLTSGNSVIMPEGSLPQESAAPLFTVLDSQLIHLVPYTVQFHQEGIPVSFVNGDLHTLSIAPPYQINQMDPFSANSNNDASIIHSSQMETTNSFTLHSLPTGNNNSSSSIHNEKIVNDFESLRNSKKSNGTSSTTHISLDTGPDIGPDIHFTTSSLTDLSYKEDDENDSISSLTSSHYLTTQDETLSQDMGSSTISIF
ncbi:Zinc finger protein 26 [Armadillidium nasatum]|uniref:Zinc finger protein 26 n=1 Tax=Armadillidium nasatum TaxID=96803 RepID=A0A5N5TEQ7_9CRUS|nr:Zinc finger protein 26 [Armadillidium nasatum]